MIVVVDYGMGNLRNVRRAFHEIGEEVSVTGDAGTIAGAKALVLPGVGAFGEAVRRIEQLGLREVLLRHASAGKPLLGICLGMQLLFEGSEESPGARGLGIFKGESRKFGAGVKVPHIGWNDVVPVAGSALGRLLSPSGCFYFVHSYYVPDSPAKAGVTRHGVEFVSAVHSGAIMGFQFHPEKSQTPGLSLLREFVRISGERGS